MSACEKCWADAARRAWLTGKDQATCYEELLIERKDHPCTADEQSGAYQERSRDEGGEPR